MRFFLSLNAGLEQSVGWAIPTATDIAFAVGILALLGSTIPANLRIILLSLAIIDDVIAVMIIAIFYSNGLDMNGAIITFLGISLVFLWQKMHIASAWAYVMPAAILWFGLLKTGIHPSLAGVVLGLVTPPRLVKSKQELLQHMRFAVAQLSKNQEQATSKTTQLLKNLSQSQRDLVAPIIRVPLVLSPYVTFGVMPIFAFANAGVRLGDVDLSMAGALPLLLGIGGGLLIGKPLGVLAASNLAVKIGLCRLPPQLDWAGMTLIGLLAGIGFTMAIFIAMLAFVDAPPFLAVAKMGILTGSFLSALLGLGFGLFYCRRAAKRL